MHRERGFSFRIYPDDHGPPHVHVWKAGVHVRILLGDDSDPPCLWTVHGMGAKNARRAIALVERHHTRLLNGWKRIHGT
ncbi:MAG: DUF4160 domain-containing protein [Gemmatimonadota bacterium]